jgi:hypothetical protein
MSSANCGANSRRGKTVANTGTCHRSLGRLYNQKGQRQQAQAELAAASALYRAMTMTFWLCQD